MKRINADSNSDRMYVQKVSLENIRSIKKLEMEFPNPAGWHVIIGDNGSGKSTVVKTIAFCIVGPKQVAYLRQSPTNWINFQAQSGSIKVEIHLDKTYDDGIELIESNPISSNIQLLRPQNTILNTPNGEHQFQGGVLAFSFNLGVKKGENGHEKEFEEKFEEKWGQQGWFSLGFGPFRKLSTSTNLPRTENTAQNIDYSLAEAHLNLFDDNSNFQSLAWLIDLNYKRLIEIEKGNSNENGIIYKFLLKFINESKLLPHGAQIEGIDKKGIIFKDGNGNYIPILDLSEGYRSILSLTFELIYQLVRVYGAQAVFADIEKGKMEINLPGVVLIDEIDAHLHPSWQVDVGFWFTQYFPQLQFIVTTHSPLVCRAAEKGSIWRLAKPGTDSEAKEITGIEKDRLVYGNILDAYGTELFGKNTVRSTQSNKKLERLGRLNMLYALGKIKPTEEKERLKLQKILSTDDPTGF